MHSADATTASADSRRGTSGKALIIRASASSEGSQIPVISTVSAACSSAARTRRSPMTPAPITPTVIMRLYSISIISLTLAENRPDRHSGAHSTRTAQIMCSQATRPSGRAPNVLRPVSITPGFSHHAEGSVLIRMGGTEVLCAASVEARVPPFLRNSGTGWVTAEYGMLPRATHTRGDREAARGKQSGRTQEIQRLIGRSLRAVVDRAVLGEMTITLDCDVLNADGGTRCASITGAWVALHLALQHLVKMNVLKTIPLTGQVAAIS